MDLNSVKPLSVDGIFVESKYQHAQESIPESSQDGRFLEEAIKDHTRRHSPPRCIVSQTP